MSRHRTIKKEIEEELDDYDDNYYDEDDYYEEQQYMRPAAPTKQAQKAPAKPAAKPASAPKTQEPDDAELVSGCLEQVQSLLGTEFSANQMKQAIRSANYDADAAVSILLDQGPQKATVLSVKPVVATPTPTSSQKVDSKKSTQTAPTAQVAPKTAAKKPAEPVSVATATAAKRPTAAEKLAADMSAMGLEVLRTDELVSVDSHAGLGGSVRPVKLMIAEGDSAPTTDTNGKHRINLVVIGHVDAGKSTLMGHLLFELGKVSSKQMHKFEKESRELGKGSFAYAWVMDEHAEERARGVTIDVGVTAFETTHKNVTLLDAPGHKDFVPNMISGAAQADAAVLVVDAAPGQFESGFESGGQTKEHALLARSLGIGQIIVAVNKMDAAGFSHSRFEEVTRQVVNFLRQSGYSEDRIFCVPVSGLSGENLVVRKEEKLSEWYGGKTLFDQIDSLEPPARLTAKPFRMVISDVFKSMATGQTVAGKVEAGMVRAGDKVLLAPTNETCTVKAIHIHGEMTKAAYAGDNVELGLTNIESNFLHIGYVLCDPAAPMPVARRFNAQLVTFQSMTMPITKGFQCLFHMQSTNEPATVTQLISALDKTTGETSKRKPRALTKGMTATVEIRTDHPVCVELYSEYKSLGRFMLRHAGETIAAGVVTELLL